MRLTKKKKDKINGITLVALVVTIVILLILAGITIATLFGDNGVINKAKKAKEETDRTAIEEQEGLNKTEQDMANAIKGNVEKDNEWTQPDPLKTEITNGEITLKIGDYVDYSCKGSTAEYKSESAKNGYKDQTFKASEYEYGWRVLGVDKNTKQLQLISEDFVQPTEGGKALGVRQAYKLKGQAGYENGVVELNKICSIYGTGTGATGARTVNVDDIDWITGYNPNNIGVKDPNKTGSGEKVYGDTVLYEYGNTVEYTLVSTGVKYESKGNRAIGGINSSYTSFKYYEESSKRWRGLAMNESVTLKSSIYSYYPTTITGVDDKTSTVGIGVNTPYYKMLFTNSSTGADTANAGKNDNFYYWLGSQCIHTNTGRVDFVMRVVSVGYVNYVGLYGSVDYVGEHYYGIRPVVTLDSKVALKDSGTMQDGCKLYNMNVNN